MFLNHKFAVLDKIERLDPQKDHQKITFLSATFDFPWDTQRALELALMRTFAVPQSSALLVSTEELSKRTQKRYDDTTIIISTIGFYGYDSVEGRTAIRRMNQMHARYKIPNDEFLYVLSTFVLEPIRWNAKYGWRKLSENEKLATYYFWVEVGKRMNIKNIPESLKKLEQFSLAYEKEHFAFSEANQVLAVATRDMFLSWILPKPLWFLGTECVHAMMDKPLRDAFGFVEPPLWTKALTRALLWSRKNALQLLPPRKAPYQLKKVRSYPKGYKLEEVGV